MVLYRNKKTGNIYKLLYTAIDCTNAREGNKVAVYKSVKDPKLFPFVRDLDEFNVKFELVMKSIKGE